MKTSVLSLSILVGFMVLVPTFAFAQPVGNSSNTTLFGNQSDSTIPGNQSDSNCTNGAQSNGTFTLCNPLKVNNFCDLIKGILNVILALGVPIATLFLVWSGFRFILARGRPAELDVAKRNFFYVIVGIAVFLGAWTLASVIGATIKELDKSGNISICR